MTLIDPDVTGSEVIHVGQTYPDIKKRGGRGKGHASVHFYKYNEYLISPYLLSFCRSKMKSFNFETPDEAVIGRLIGAKGERVRTLREMLRSVSNYTPANEVWGEGILVSPCPSVCPYVCLSVRLPSVDMILSKHVLGKECIVFPENSTLIACHLKINMWYFHIDWRIFLHFIGFFLFLDLVIYLMSYAL